MSTIEIEESYEGGWLRLAVVGELDHTTAPKLEERLTQLRASSVDVRVDLSKVLFMDSTGLQVLVQARNHALARGCRLEVNQEVSPQVRRLFELVGLDRLTSGKEDTER